MNITTVNLSDGQLKELRNLGVENLSKLVRSLVNSYIQKARRGNKEYVKKKERARMKLMDVEKKWFEVELGRAIEKGNREDQKYYEKMLGRENFEG